MASDEAANFVLERGRAVYAELQQARAEVERLKAALGPFSEIGARLSAAHSKSDQSTLLGASAVRLNLHPLTGQNFVDAFNAYQQYANPSDLAAKTGYDPKRDA